MKYLFAIIYTVLIALIAYICVDYIYKNLMPEDIVALEKNPGEMISKDISLNQVKPIAGMNQYEIILKRNLFNVEVKEKESSLNQNKNKSEKLEPTKLDLVLWGTVTGTSKVYAVIEDKKIRQQSLYEVGDSIQEAKIKQILRHKIILTYKDKDQVLEMEIDDKKVSKPRISAPKKDSLPKILNRSLVDGSLLDDLLAGELSPDNLPISDLLGNINALMRQAKFRPHFTEGEPDGLMVYGIRPNSVFKHMGLRNGDIIKDINGTPIGTTQDVLSLFSEIREADSTRVTLLRRGKEKQLVYQSKDGNNVQ